MYEFAARAAAESTVTVITATYEAVFMMRRMRLPYRAFESAFFIVGSTGMANTAAEMSVTVKRGSKNSSAS